MRGPLCPWTAAVGAAPPVSMLLLGIDPCPAPPQFQCCFLRWLTPAPHLQFQCCFFRLTPATHPQFQCCFPGAGGCPAPPVSMLFFGLVPAPHPQFQCCFWGVGPCPAPPVSMLLFGVDPFPAPAVSMLLLGVDPCQNLVLTFSCCQSRPDNIETGGGETHTLGPFVG